MKKKHRKNQKILVVFLFLSLLVNERSFGQITGSLFMQPNNFYAQMYNPSYMRTDKAIEISFAGLGGFSFINQGSFKISDLITTPYGSPVVDVENLYKNISTNNFIRQYATVPMAFVSIPLKKGVIKFFYKENVSSVLKFKEDIIEFLVNGNIQPEYRNFNTGDVKLLTSGYREFAVGYAKKINKKLDVGIHAKLLFGAAILNADNWNYGLETTADANVIKFIPGGRGQMALPVSVNLRPDSTIFSLESKNSLKKYFNEYGNPGFAFDFGATYQLNNSDKISISVRDLGAIWYKHDPMILNKGGSYDYIGFDLVNAIRYPEEKDQGYIYPPKLIGLVKDSIRNIWHPKIIKKSFIFDIASKTVLHYQHAVSDFLSLGVTNQSAFQRNNFQNILTLSGMQSWLNLSVFENVNLHGASDVSIGGGIQYEGNYAQLFLATDNLIAFYHPANNKTFSVTAGICILLNHKKEKKSENGDKGFKKRKGKISPELPYYKKLRKLKN